MKTCLFLYLAPQSSFSMKFVSPRADSNIITRCVCVCVSFYLHACICVWGWDLCISICICVCMCLNVYVFLCICVDTNGSLKSIPKVKLL